MSFGTNVPKNYKAIIIMQSYIDNYRDDNPSISKFYNSMNNLSILIHESIRNDINYDDGINYDEIDEDTIDMQHYNNQKMVYMDIPNYRINPIMVLPYNKVYMCTFTIVNDSMYPYLLYLGKKMPDIYGENIKICMPSFLFKCRSANKQINNALLMDDAVSLVNDLFPDDDISYAGYTNVSDGVVLFIKLVQLVAKSIYDTPENDYIWLLGCEIINSRIAETHKIDDTMYYLFIRNSSLSIIRDYKNNIIRQPVVGYVKTSNYYFNKKTGEYILYRSQHKEYNAINNMITFDSEYPYYVQVNPISNNNQKSKTFRVAIFIQNSECILDELCKPSSIDSSALLYIYAGRLHYAVDDPRCYTVLSTDCK